MAMACRLIKQALAVYVFFPAAGPAADQAYVHLLEVWSSCGDHLGMTEPIPSLKLPAELPAGPVPAGRGGRWPPVSAPARRSSKRSCSGSTMSARCW